MKIIDITEITISSGDGGNGAIAFRREKHVPNGGPSGGDGGKGGDVILIASTELHTLLDFKYKHHFKAEHGKNGNIKKMNGKKGQDLIIKLPPGTVVKDRDRDKVLCDLNHVGKTFTVAKGGTGGRGNTHFVNATHQAPRYAEPGEKGKTLNLSLELKSIADVGLVGLPNAGKSSLLAAVSAARPKVANYPFTTLRPNLGVIRHSNGDGFIMADIPGLIEGAAEGIGLGHDFLRHIERTRLLLHMVDISDLDPEANFNTIQKELIAYPAAIEDKPQIVVLNKTDLFPEEDLEVLIEAFKELTEHPVFAISAVTHKGTKELLYAIEGMLEKLPPIPEIEVEIDLEEEEEAPVYEIVKEGQTYIVESEYLERMLYLSDIDDSRALNRFHKKLENLGVIKALQAKGASTGSTVRIGDLEFEHL